MNLLVTQSDLAIGGVITVVLWIVVIWLVLRWIGVLPRKPDA